MKPKFYITNSFFTIFFISMLFSEKMIHAFCSSRIHVDYQRTAMDCINLLKNTKAVNIIFNSFKKWCSIKFMCLSRVFFSCSPLNWFEAVILGKVLHLWRQKRGSNKNEFIYSIFFIRRRLADFKLPKFSLASNIIKLNFAANGKYWKLF